MLRIVTVGCLINLALAWLDNKLRTPCPTI
jgi:hypothetical protein